MSALDLDALEALCDAATPGPWVAAPSPWEGVSAPHGDPRDGGSCEIVDCVRGPSHGDAAFIAAAREALPALITRLRAAEGRTAWQPIASVPIGETVKLWSPVRRVCIGHVTTLSWCEYTHWMPLDAAPEAP